MTQRCKLTVDNNLQPHVTADGNYWAAEAYVQIPNNSQNLGKTALRAKRTSPKKGPGLICAKHPPGRSGKLNLVPFSVQQNAAAPVEKELDLGEGVTMKFMLVPAGSFVMGDPHGFADETRQSIVTIARPFYMGRFEVTNGQFARFNPRHDSGVINERWKDRSRRGTPINQPDCPVVRISWNHAMEFCRWLSAKTGCRATLPTEAQWEWACRGGTDTPFSVGRYTQGMKPFANIADERARSWNHGRAEPGYNDGIHFTAPGGRFPPNAWGLCDIHGNVAEWCLSAYKPYPYNPDDGRDDPTSPGMKVVRGGSWNDTLRQATSASRWRYEPHKPVYNVGFRVVIEAEPNDVVAAADS